MELKGYVCILDRSLSLTSKITFRRTRTDKRASTPTRARARTHTHTHKHTPQTHQ